MPRKRKAEVVAAENDASNSEEAVESPVKTSKPEVKNPSRRGRGRPPLSDEEKAKRAAKKKAPSGRGRGRPKGSTMNKAEVKN